jgi:hypothetical protein
MHVGIEYKGVLMHFARAFGDRRLGGGDAGCEQD